MTVTVNQTCSKKVALPNACSENKKSIRVCFDNESQGSYILTSTAEELGLEVKGIETYSAGHSQT